MAAVMVAGAQSYAIAGVLGRVQASDQTRIEQRKSDADGSTQASAPAKPAHDNSDDSSDPSRSASSPGHNGKDDKPCTSKTEDRRKTCVPAQTPIANTETIVAIVPPVIFQSNVYVVKGQLKAGVLVAGGEPVGTARIKDTDCVSQAVPGKVTWLSCPSLRDRDKYTIYVSLSDGRVFSRSLTTSSGSIQED